MNLIYIRWKNMDLRVYKPIGLEKNTKLKGSNLKGCEENLTKIGLYAVSIKILENRTLF